MWRFFVQHFNKIFFWFSLCSTCLVIRILYHLLSCGFWFDTCIAALLKLQFGPRFNYTSVAGLNAILFFIFHLIWSLSKQAQSKDHPALSEFPFFCVVSWIGLLLQNVNPEQNPFWSYIFFSCSFMDNSFFIFYLQNNLQSKDPFSFYGYVFIIY